MANQQVTIKSGTTKKSPATFAPSPLPVKVGDTVTWNNTDIIQHWPTPKTGPAWFASAINPGATSSPTPAIPSTVPVDYFCKLHASETSYIQAGSPEIVKLTIVAGSLPSKTINRNDSVFWFNNTSDKYELFYNPGTGDVPWGKPPYPLPPKQPSSEVVFPNPGIFPYQCKLHPGQKGTITVL
jgi:plastocyanin